MAVVGVGFNVKMAEALGVVPAFAAVYLAAGPSPLYRRVRDVAVGLVILAAVALSWPAMFDLTPAAARPFAGSSTHNSMLELAAVYNGIDRFIPRARFGQARGAGAAPGVGPLAPGPGAQARSGAGAGARRPGIMGGGAPAGPLRLFTPGLAAEAGWLLPLAAVAAAALFLALRRRRFAGPLSPRQTDVLLWSGWALCYGVVYSAAGGMFRPYYLVTLAPPLAALAAIGAAALWRRAAEGRLYRIAAAAALLATALWELYIAHGVAASGAGRMGFLGAPGEPAAWQPWVYGLLACGTIASVIGVLAASGRAARAAVAAGVAALLIVPAGSSFGSMVGRAAFAMAPVPAFAAGAPRRGRPAPPGARFGFGEMTSDRKLIAFLTANRGGARYLLATTSAMQAAPIIIATGQPVMAMGGFTGRDPILTVPRLAGIVAQGDLRFAMVGGARGFGARAGDPAPQQAALMRWIRDHGRPVDPSLWRSGGASPAPAAAQGFRGVRGAAPMQLFDLSPGTALRAP